MWRNLLKMLGEKANEISLGYIYTGMGVLSASGVILFVDVSEEMSIPEIVYSPKNWIAAVVGTVIFIVLGIMIQGLFTGIGKALVFMSGWYPNWYYFPRIEAAPKLTKENEIELEFTNPKKSQKLSLRVEYAILESNVTPLPSLAYGVAPYSKRQIFPLSQMIGRCSRKRVIGRVENGRVILVMGEEDNESMEIAAPGIYRYYYNISGEFRGREFGGVDKFTIFIGENQEVKIKE